MCSTEVSCVDVLYLSCVSVIAYSCDDIWSKERCHECRAMFSLGDGEVAVIDNLVLLKMSFSARGIHVCSLLLFPVHSALHV